MKKFLAVIISGLFIVSSGMASVALAVEKIGYVDVDKAANESEEGKKAVANLKDFMSSKQALITEKGKALEKMKADLEKQGAIISPDAKRSKIEEIERSEREFQRIVSDINIELEKKRRELTESIYKEIIDVIEKTGQEGKYSVILTGQSLLYVDKSLDITDTIIKKYNEIKGAKAKK
ncbi:MAG: OmpH family outer membrane protein [Nitrospirae bacterium]|nr:OmpH family outer membrane protein [Nitrospirota bacterium]